jgi:hypothetical protein
MRVRSMFIAGALLALSGGVAVAADTPEQASSNQKPQPWPMETIQGFHVVLVVGETQAGEAPSTQQLPQGAARALNDMREFLPYKHYRVLDAQWSSCCSGPQSRLSGRLQGVLGVPGPDGAVKLVHRPYNFHLTARSSAVGIQTRFVLVAQDARASHSSDHAEAERLLKNAQEDLATFELRVSEVRSRVEIGTATPLELREQQDRLTQMKREVEALQARLERGETGGEAGVMDSSFTMAAGETVVVGTSRLGGDKALIALVTAVPKGTK